MFPKTLALAAAAAFALGAAAIHAPTSTASALGLAAQAADVETSPSGMALGVFTLGDENAPVTVIEYASLTCPHCASFQRDVFGGIKRDYIDSGKIRYEFREVYFDRFGLAAAQVARCAGPERYFGLIDLLLSRQDDWTRADDPAEKLKTMGRQVGMSAEQIDACIADEDGARALVTMYQGFRNDPRLTGTPTLIVGEDKVENPTLANLSAAIDAALED